MEGKKWARVQPPLFAAVAFLLGRTSVLGALFPYGLALLAVAASFRLAPRLRLLIGAAVLVGSATLGDPLVAIQVGAALITFELLWLILSESLVGRVQVLAPLAAVVGGFIAHTVWHGYVLPIALFRFAIDGGLTVVLIHAFGLGLPLLLEPPRLRAVTLDEVLGVGVLLLSAIGGIGNWLIAEFSLRNVLGTLIVLILANFGGAPLGAAMGAVFGLLATLGSDVVLAAAGLYAFSGFAGGVSRGLGRWGTVMMFGIVHLALSHFSGGISGALSGLEAIAAGLLLGFMPARWNRSLQTVLAGASPVLGDAASPQHHVQDGAAKRLHELAQLFGELGRAFDQVAAAKPRPVRDDEALAAIFAAVAERACRGCPLHQTCWQEDMFPTYSSLRSLWARVELDGPAEPESLPGPLRRRCLRPQVVVGTVNYLYDLLRVDRFWEQRVSEARLLVATQLRGVAQIMDRMADEVRANITQTVPRLAARRPARFAYRAGVSRLNKTGSQISGDSYLIRPLDGGRLLVALSDGMGAGVPAALESRATMTLLERLMETGFGATLSIQTINSILLLRSPEEKFATMDLALFDLWQGQCDLIKIGAAPSYIKRGATVAEWRAPSVPAGILHQIDVETTQRQLGSGDYLVMLSDGLLAARGTADTDWIQTFLADCPAVAPQVMSEALLAHALGGQTEVADDMTVIVLRLTEERGQRPALT